MDTSGPRDSRINRFLLRARTILAEERGLNEKSRIKLRALADDLRLPQVLYESAISQLMEGTAALDGELTRYEKQFVKWLEKYLQPLSGHVLTPAQEEKAIQRGTEEYQIAPDRARDLVRQAATRAGVGRVSRLDATGHVALLVDDAIRHETVASATTRERLIETALSWGVDASQTAALINNRLEANRQATRPVRPVWMIALAAVASVVVVVLLILFFLKQSARTTGEPVDSAGTAVARAPDVNNDEVPADWSEPLKKAWDDVLALDRDLALPRHLIVSDRADERRDAMTPLVDFALEGSVGRREAFARFIELWIRKNPETGDHLLRELVSRVSPESAELTVRSSERSFRALEQLALLQAGNSALAVESALASGLPAGFMSEHTFTIDLAREGLVRKIWSDLNQLAVRYPHEAAQKYGPLLELTGSQMPGAARLAWDSGLRIFCSPGEDWQIARDSWQSTFPAMSPDQVFQAYDSLTRFEDVDRRGWLLPLLAQKAGIPTEGVPLSAIETKLRSWLGLADSVTTPVAKRLELLRSLPDFAASRASGPLADPQAIANTAWLSTSAFLLWRAALANDAKLLEMFDEMVATGPESLSDPDRNEIDWQTLPVYGKTLRRPSPPDIEARRVVFENLSTEKKASPEGRASSIERLAGIASLFADLTPEQAGLLADVLLNARETPEVVAIEQHAEKFSHWPSLALAVAERLKVETVSLDQALTVTHLLAGKHFLLPKQGEWREGLYRALLERIADGLQYTAEQQGVDTRYRWDGLCKYLVRLGKIRCLAAGVPSTRLEKMQTPSELLALMIQQMRPDDPRIRSCSLLAEDQFQEYLLLTQLLERIVRDMYEEAVDTDAGQDKLHRGPDTTSCPVALHWAELQLLDTLAESALDR